MKSGEKPKMKGSLKTAHSLADSLLIRYYETEDDREAAFGHTTTFEDWKKSAALKMISEFSSMGSPMLPVTWRCLWSV